LYVQTGVARFTTTADKKVVGVLCEIRAYFKVFSPEHFRYISNADQ
jgi:hypothetical protein